MPGRAKVVKTVNGQPPSSTQSFTFQLRSGASASSAGTILEAFTATSSLSTYTFTTLLTPGATYNMCEQVMPGWMTTLGPPFYTVYNPSGDNSVVCTNFVAVAATTTTFTIDNKPPPGGLARTIGFWKNWASCAGSNGGQTPKLDQTLASFPIAAGQTTHGVYIGLTYVDTCAKAVAILNKSTYPGGKKASSDPAFNLAAQLLGAVLNVQAGAGQNGCVVNAINSAQDLLKAVGFTGTQTPVKMTTAQAAQANSLATTLDKYNNTTSCP